MSSVAYRCPDSPEDPLAIPGSSLDVVWRTLGHPGMFPWVSLRHRPTWCPEDPLDIPGSSLGVPSDTGPHGVRRIPWTSRDPPLVSPQTQAHMVSGGSLGHPGILPWCPLRHRPPLASFPNSSRARMKNRKKRGEPGKIYHVRNVIGREDLIPSGRTNELAHALCILVPLRKLL